MQLELEYNPQDFTVSGCDNLLLHDQTGFTIKSENIENGKFTLNTVVLERKEKQIKNIDSLCRIKINPVKETQTSMSYRWKVYDIQSRIISQGSDEIQLKIHHTLPENYALHQNFPNPFNPSTTLRYQLPVDSKVQIEIFNILGERVTTLVDKSQKAGYYSEIWDISNSGSGIASGIYFVRFLASGIDNQKYVNHKKMIVLK